MDGFLLQLNLHQLATSLYIALPYTWASLDTISPFKRSHGSHTRPTSTWTTPPHHKPSTNTPSKHETIKRLIPCTHIANLIGQRWASARRVRALRAPQRLQLPLLMLAYPQPRRAPCWRTRSHPLTRHMFQLKRGGNYSAVPLAYPSSRYWRPCPPRERTLHPRLVMKFHLLHSTRAKADDFFSELKKLLLKEVPRICQRVV